MAGLFGNSGEFFLDEDDSKTLGNIEYMRTSKVTRRTFPKTASNKVGELVQQVSATEDQKLSEYQPKSSKQSATNGTSNGFQAQTFSSFQPAEPTPIAATTPVAEPTPAPVAATTPVAEPTPAPVAAPVAATTPVVEQPVSAPDNSMDMFRNMAKQIRSGRR